MTLVALIDSAGPHPLADLQARAEAEDDDESDTGGAEQGAIGLQSRGRRKNGIIRQPMSLT